MCHLANKIIDPQYQGTDHGEEAEEVASVGQFLASTIAQILQLEPAIDHLSLPTDVISRALSRRKRLVTASSLLAHLVLDFEEFEILKIKIK